MTLLDDPTVTGEVTELLQGLIRNACVNDGTDTSGDETRSVELLEGYFTGSGLDFERVGPTDERQSLVARIEGTDPSAPTIVLMGHTDVVPVTAEHWERDPFGGELVDGMVWGRGAVDMLNLTASMAVATKRLATEGWAPKGTLVYFAVADEEALGTFGAEWVVEHARDMVEGDYVVTEAGGMPMRTPDGIKLPVIVGEKGLFWCTLRVRGTAGHGSQPLRTDNALVKAAEVVRRIDSYQPATVLHDVWRRFIEAMGFPEELAGPLLDPDEFMGFVETLPMLGLARQAHACTHATFAPTMATGGVKHNVIPDVVEIAVDVRTLPGQSRADVERMFDEMIGDDLRPDVEVEFVVSDEASQSPIDTPLWDLLQRAASSIVPGTENIPFLTVGGTDARFFRRLGVPAYGFGLFSERIGFDEFAAMFHGDNERVDQESLRLSTVLWDAVARDLLA